MSQMETAWLAIAEHIKGEFMRKHGSQSWYDLIDQCGREGLCGIDAFKAAISKLACSEGANSI